MMMDQTYSEGKIQDITSYGMPQACLEMSHLHFQS